MPWWTALIPIGYDLLKGLFGGGNQAQATQTTTAPARAPMDPGYTLLSPMVLRTLLQNYSRLSGAGFPGGKGIGQDWTADILRVLESQMPSILGQMGKTGASVNPLATLGRGQLGR